MALKFLPPESARDPEARQRFQREAQAASALNHANICTIYDVGEHDGASFIAMELLEGCTLLEHIASQPLSTSELLRLSVRVVSEPGDIALDQTARRYAVLHETVHRNLYRIPLH